MAFLWRSPSANWLHSPPISWLQMYTWSEPLDAFQYGNEVFAQLTMSRTVTAATWPPALRSCWERRYAKHRVGRKKNVAGDGSYRTVSIRHENIHTKLIAMHSSNNSWCYCKWGKNFCGQTFVFLYSLENGETQVIMPHTNLSCCCNGDLEKRHCFP